MPGYAKIDGECIERDRSGKRHSAPHDLTKSFWFRQRSSLVPERRIWYLSRFNGGVRPDETALMEPLCGHPPEGTHSSGTAIGNKASRPLIDVRRGKSFRHLSYFGVREVPKRHQSLMQLIGRRECRLCFAAHPIYGLVIKGAQCAGARWLEAAPRAYSMGSAFFERSIIQKGIRPGRE